MATGRRLASGFRRALDGKGFTEIQTPKIVGTSTESGANVFALGYFGRRGYLAQSPQFYKQMLVGVYERVYETGPVSGPSRTTRCVTSPSMSRWMWSSASSMTPRRPENVARCDSGHGGGDSGDRG
ncbi:MAG TPA: amino acid--tRNA ligase-related protein [Pseudonocardiaceae bacterium]|nr:amino acid--tRNA ligase-related protein [Pseudonocardiaceae bacterium]